MLAVALAATAAGCGGGEGSVDPQSLEGTWSYSLSEEYLLENGISEQQAKGESGAHTAELRDGEFTDRWRTADGSTGSCSGTYAVEGSTVTFTWKTGCFGDWQMRPTLEGDRLTWSDVEALPPYASDEDQKVAEVFNGVPWTRTTGAG